MLTGLHDSEPRLRAERRGKLKIYIGMSAGVGKTYRMLQEAQTLLGAPVGLPAGPRLYRSSGGIVSALLATPDGTVLASELAYLPAGIAVKKVASERTRVAAVRVGDTQGFWLTGGRHVVLQPAPARLAGHVLLWQVGRATYRLEGRRLRLGTALAIARDIAR